MLALKREVRPMRVETIAMTSLRRARSLVGALAMRSVKGLSIFAAARRSAMALGYAVVVARSRVTSQRIQGHEGSSE
jgi:hypothetical protein